MNEYVVYPEDESLAQAHLASMEKARREREEEARRYIIELEKIVRHQPNGFAD